MAGRNRNSVSASGHRHKHRSHGDSRSHPPPELHLMEDRIAAQSHEIQTLIMDNQRLAATHVALKQDVSAIQQEIRRLSATAASVKAEKDAQVRDVYERYQKLEAEARSIEGLYTELNRVRAEIKDRMAEREELSAKLQEIDGEIARTKSEFPQVPDLKAEIEKMHTEVQRGRSAIEYERKMQSHNFKVSEVMEKHLSSMTQEAERLHSELANAEKRSMGAASAPISAANPGPGYAIQQRNLEPAYGGNPLSDPYTTHQGTLDTSLNYASGTISQLQAPPIRYDIQGQQIQS